MPPPILSALVCVCAALAAVRSPEAFQSGPVALVPAELLRDLTRGARLPGSAAERAAAERCAALLAAAGLETSVRSEPLEVRLPTRQELQAFDGPSDTLAFFERYESFDWTAQPPWPAPPVVRETPTADVRAQLVDVGAGTALDYERLAEQKVDVAGHVALVRSDADFEALAREAEGRGVVGLLVARPRAAQPSAARRWPEGPWASDRVLAGGAVHRGCTLPVAPVRLSEAEQLAARLRVKRVRAADGSTQNVRVGPGPIEVRLALEVPAHRTTQLVVVAETQGAGAGTPLLAAPLAAFGTDACAAAETVACVLAATRRGGAQGLVVQLGGAPPECALTAPLSALGRGAAPGRGFGPLLDYATDLAGTAADLPPLVLDHCDPGLRRIEAVAWLAADLASLGSAVPPDRIPRALPWLRAR